MKASESISWFDNLDLIFFMKTIYFSIILKNDSNTHISPKWQFEVSDIIWDSLRSGQLPTEDVSGQITRNDPIGQFKHIHHSSFVVFFVAPTNKLTPTIINQPNLRITSIK